MSRKRENTETNTSNLSDSNSGRKVAPQSRRQLLSTVAAGVGTTAVAGCLGGGGDDPLTISVFGGAFKEILDRELFEPFSEETGIEFQSQAQGGTAEVLPTIEAGVEAGEAPVDVMILTLPGVFRGENSNLWHRWDHDEFDNLQYIKDDLQNTNDDGELFTMPGLGWFINLVHNTDEVDDGPTSWDMLWDSQWEDQLGIMTPAVTGYLPDVAAATRFDEGQDILDTEDGIREVFEELSEITPQGALWYTNEANFQSRLAQGEIPAGMLYHDITRVLRLEQDAPVESTFAEEGSIFETGEWVVPRTTDKIDEVREFIDYSLDPEVQDHVARELFTTPITEEQHTELTDEEFEAAAGPGIDAAIHPNFEMYVEQEELINTLWDEMIGEEGEEEV